MMSAQGGNQSYQQQQKASTAMSVRTSGNMNQQNKIQPPGSNAAAGPTTNTGSTRALHSSTNMYQ
jgi:hypothetical protein